MKKNLILRWQRTQQGAAAIEFALLFLMFFVLFYAIVAYSLAMLLMQGLTQAAEEGVRSAIAVDRLAFATEAAYDSHVENLVRTRVQTELSWLPDKAKQKVLSAENIVVLPTTVGTQKLMTVTVRYPGYATDGLIPTLKLPLVGDVPRLPNDLVGKASVQL